MFLRAKHHRTTGIHEGNSVTTVDTGRHRLDQQTVGASSLNVFKTRISMIRNTRMGFFTD